ncbi:MULTISPECIES: bifunctional tRNA (5-methylaminomethyl-2-thiouridine)(34)-methyltransferase MnmD/FAD-dependent 5-carboxymethylaminomethyl-2-thiouridine(34) oxidoreductase MnmC [Burkholderia]|uniref:bifunctional tRNA (5-methylaminomethyl-2-thiouridine)(34)-methyltransferase MnmD/FAD-dependent 5-carboxymethylaminomethyl-2-thiouridine(34) oxidoreductase MnmC n=1 Tax=Burkholderia TaxID=32008 RepID=UPI000756D379|nr:MULTISPECIES: bifunctional tRNA (5-methylaminomethyl-2-thiouridine)(34)-methyltransferase MnmD/FAD-dependent 5-carboxymethylaminomethyl-2-thiouridine(34) oxidoreductase MnmC [Burkholderia]AOJ70536.1 FAD-dependent cmnm(5)s(2)U34 oxidoreductase [Burkholderia savannae]KVG47458.1 FAD-dependent cmnm(5)s(2)U34 oxidoreductase [Burkholderia sp. MSMB0265]KVG82411.1 FAD-dependent cmnm(5)s(2)U34 oxidoreductase [Burkholderia sp. MSMB2040]KVG92653.1 FAD-dependent cmnm(5)s(2)U34 oxidoreductase [Burkholder
MPDRIVPATLVFREDGTVVSPLYGDIYHSAAGALAQADHVFIRGNDLPKRWQHEQTFTIFETGFGTGCNFLATWAAWRADPSRCERLHFVSVEKHPFARDDLRRAAAHIVAYTTIEPLVDELANAWPALTPGVHRLEFDGARVTLTLAFGDALDVLPNLVLRANAFYLDGFAPTKNADLWSPAIFKSLAKLADDHATFATYTSSGAVKRALDEAGFACRKVEGFAGKRAMLVGEFAPRWRVRRHEPPRALDVGTRDALVIGAGLAGCAVVERLAARGWHVTLVERRERIASEASGNPAGVFHPMIARDDNLASRLSRAGFLHALGRWRALERAGHAFARSTRGLVQLATSDDEFERMRDTIDALGVPAELAAALSRDQTRALLQTEVAHGGWWFPQGGSISPAALAAAQCAAAGERLVRIAGVEVARLERGGDGRWRALDASGATLAQASVVVVANAADAARVAGLRHAPTQRVRGQLTLLPPGSAPAVPLPVIGDGYVVPLADGVTLTGATYEPDDADTALREAGHRENLERLERLLPAFSATTLDARTLAGRVGFRCVASDRLPLVGELPDETAAARNAAALTGARLRDVPRAAGLYGAFGYGSRGLVWASLGADLIAAQIEGEPWPLERELAEAIDPARFLVRALRHGRAD